LLEGAKKEVQQARRELLDMRNQRLEDDRKVNAAQCVASVTVTHMACVDERPAQKGTDRRAPQARRV
jgi:hypothetical protein